MTNHVGRAYDARAAEYIELIGEVDQLAARDREGISAWADAVHGRILDAGCGPGLWTRFLHDRGHEVLGIDLSERFIAHAQAQHPELEFVHGSFAEIPAPDASLGGVLAWYSLIHTSPEQLPPILAEFARVLVPGGSILIGFFDGTPREPFAHAVAPAYFWTPDALAALLEDAGFTVMSSESRPRVAGEVSSRPHASVTAARVRPSVSRIARG
ncbi:MAG: class I SAM-dependent methyltransferase [Microbacterium sp.]